MKKRVHQIELFKKYPLEVQEELMKDLCRMAQHTEFGLMYDFSSIKSASQFKERVPIRTYEDFEPYISRLREGEQNLLWPTKQKWFAKSSGTTSGESKYIPVTLDSLKECHYKGGKDLLSIYYKNNPNTQLFKGKHLIVGGNENKFSGNTKTVEGDLSAIIMKNLPWWCEWRRSPKKIKLLLSQNWEEKLKYVVKNSPKDDVQIIAGAPSWVLVIMNEIIKEKKCSNGCLAESRIVFTWRR